MIAYDDAFTADDAILNRRLNRLFAEWKRSLVACGQQDEIGWDGALPGYSSSRKHVVFIGNGLGVNVCPDIIEKFYNEVYVDQDVDIDHSHLHCLLFYITYGIANKKPKWKDLPWPSKMGHCANENGVSFALIDYSKGRSEDYLGEKGLGEFFRRELEILEPDLIVLSNLGEKIPLMGRADLKYSNENLSLYSVEIGSRIVPVADVWDFADCNKDIEKAYYLPIMEGLSKCDIFSFLTHDEESRFMELFAAGKEKFHGSDGAQPDYAGALEYFRAAFEINSEDHDTLIYLGLCLLNLPTDDERSAHEEMAFKFFSKAHRSPLEDGSGTYYLALCYVHGFGCESDGAWAVRLFKESAKKGHAGALYEYGRRLLNGLDIEADVPMGLGYLQNAADAGNVKAVHVLADFYAINKDYPVEDRLRYLRSAADGGDLNAQFWLGNLFDDLGENEQAIKYLSLAKQNGHETAGILLHKIVQRNAAEVETVLREDSSQESCERVRPYQAIEKMINDFEKSLKGDRTGGVVRSRKITSDVAQWLCSDKTEARQKAVFAIKGILQRGIRTGGGKGTAESSASRRRLFVRIEDAGFWRDVRMVLLCVDYQCICRIVDRWQEGDAIRRLKDVGLRLKRMEQSKDRDLAIRACSLGESILNRDFWFDLKTLMGNRYEW